MMGAWFEEILGEKLVPGVLDTVETEAKYSGYIRQQVRHIGHMKNSEARHIPASVEYSAIPGLSREVRDKLERVRPLRSVKPAEFPE